MPCSQPPHQGERTHMQVLQSYGVAPSATSTFLCLSRSYTDGSTCSNPLTVCLLLCHHMKSFLTLSNGYRASLCPDGPLLDTDYYHHLGCFSIIAAQTYAVLNASSYVSPLLCAVMFIGQISSTGSAGVESISQFSFGVCSKAYCSHLNSH